MLFSTLNQPIILFLFAYLGLLSAVIYFLGKNCGKLLSKKLDSRIKKLSIIKAEKTGVYFAVKEELKNAIYSSKNFSISYPNKTNVKIAENGIFRGIEENFTNSKSDEKLYEGTLNSVKNAKQKKHKKFFKNFLAFARRKRADSTPKNSTKSTMKIDKNSKEKVDRKKDNNTERKKLKEEKALKRQQKILREKQLREERQKNREKKHKLLKNKTELVFIKVRLLFLKVASQFLKPMEVLIVVGVVLLSYFINLYYNFGHIIIFYIIVWVAFFCIGILACKIVANYILSFYNYIVKRLKNNERTK